MVGADQLSALLQCYCAQLQCYCAQLQCYSALGWYLVPIGLHAHHPIIPCCRLCRRCSPVIYGIGMPLPPRLLTRTATYGLSVGRSHTAAQ